MKKLLQFIKAHPVKSIPIWAGIGFFIGGIIAISTEGWCAVCDIPAMGLALLTIGAGVLIYRKQKPVALSLMGFFIASNGLAQHPTLTPGFLSWDVQPEKVYTVSRSYDLKQWTMIMAPAATSYLPISQTEESQFFFVQELNDIDLKVTQTGPYSWDIEATSFVLQDPCSVLSVFIDGSRFEETYEISPEGRQFTFALEPHMVPNGFHKIEFILGFVYRDEIVKESSFITQEDVCDADGWNRMEDDFYFRFFTSTREGRFRAILYDDQGFQWLDTGSQDISEFRYEDDGTITLQNPDIMQNPEVQFVREFMLLLWVEPAIQLAHEDEDHAKPFAFYLKPHYRKTDRKAVVVKQEDIMTEQERAAGLETIFEDLCESANNFFQAVLPTYDLNANELRRWQPIPPNLLSTPGNWNSYYQTICHTAEARLRDASHTLIVSHCSRAFLGGRPNTEVPQAGVAISRRQLEQADLNFAIIEGCEGGFGRTPLVALMLRLPDGEMFPASKRNNRPLRFGYAWDGPVVLNELQNFRRFQYLLRIIQNLIANDGHRFTHTAISARNEAGTWMANQPVLSDATDQFVKKPIRLVGCFDCTLADTFPTARQLIEMPPPEEARMARPILKPKLVRP